MNNNWPDCIDGDEALQQAHRWTLGKGAGGVKGGNKQMNPLLNKFTFTDELKDVLENCKGVSVPTSKAELYEDRKSVV